MKKYIVYLFATLFFFSAQSNAQLLIKSVLDGALTHGTPKAIQFYAPFDIPDLSAYSVESSNCIDPLQTDCTPVDVEYTFPAVSVQAGTCFWLSVLDNNFIAPDTLREILGGEDPLFTSNVALFNGDDALMVQYLGMPHDVYGIPGTDGTGANWEYTDGYVVRKDSVYAPQSSFINSEWNIYPYFWGTDIQQYITAGREYNFACTLPKVASLAVENCNCQFLVTSYTFDAGTYDLVLTSNNSPIYNFEIKFYNNSDWQNFKAALTAMQQPSRTVDLADGGGSYVSFYFSNNVTLTNSDSLNNAIKYSIDLSVDVPPDNIFSCPDVYDYEASNNMLESAWAALPDGSAIGNGWFKLDVLLPQENCIYLALDCPNLQSLIYHQNLYELPLQAAALLAAVQQDYPGVQGWNNAYCDFWTLPNDSSDYIPVSFPDTIPLAYESCTTAEQLYYLYSKVGNNNGTVNNGHPDTLVYGNSFTYLGVLDNTAVHPIQGYGIAGWYVYAVCASSVPPNDSNGHDWVLASDYPLQPISAHSAYTEPLCNNVSTCAVDSTLSCPANTTLVFAGTYFNLPSDAAVLLDSIQAYYPNVVAWTDGDFCSVVTSGDEDYIPVGLPLSAQLHDGTSFLACPITGTYEFDNVVYTIGIDDAALEAAIEAFYNAQASYDTMTCVYHQIGGVGSLPIDGQIPIKTITCNTVNLSQITVITSNVCNTTPTLTDVTTWANNTRYITDNSNPVGDVSDITYNLAVYNPDMSVKSNTVLLGNAPAGSTTPSFTVNNGERFVMNKIVTDISGCKHYLYEYNTAFDDIYCFADFSKYSQGFAPYTVIQNSSYIQDPTSSGAIRLGCDIVGVNSDNYADYVNIEVSCRTFAPLHHTEVTLSNVTTNQNYTFLLSGNNHIQLSDESEILQYFPAGFTQGDMVQWHWKIWTINDIVSGTYAEYSSSIISL